MILILGVTASGKGAVAFELARKIGGEIISIDSMKVYRRMDIGTAKPSGERRQAIRHHILDVIEPQESFSLDQFLRHADEAIGQITAAGKQVVAVGGTALYIKALLYGIFDGPSRLYIVKEFSPLRKTSGNSKLPDVFFYIARTNLPISPSILFPPITSARIYIERTCQRCQDKSWACRMSFFRALNFRLQSGTRQAKTYAKKPVTR